MNKSLVGCFVLLFIFTGCTKSHEVAITHPYQERSSYGPAITMPFTTMLGIHDCPIFASDSTNTLQAMIIACNASNFEYLNINIETINPNVYCINITGNHGFATLWVDKGIDSCVLEFFCVDDTYNLQDFIDAFMTEFNSIEHKDDWFEELIEAWELDESIVTT